jgi:hypothetical protein
MRKSNIDGNLAILKSRSLNEVKMTQTSRTKKATFHNQKTTPAIFDLIV